MATEAPVQTTVTELPDSRARVQVKVVPGEVERRLERRAQALGRELKLPGFRKGKVPAPLVLQRVGREAVLDEAVRDGLPGWYAEAIAAAAIVPVGDPKIELSDLPGQGEGLEFTIEIGVLPKARLGEYKGLEAPRREPAVAEQSIDQEIEGMRERLARLETVERAAGEGDFVVVDYVGSIDGEPFAGGEGRDQLVELGGGNLIPGFEEGLIGAVAGTGARTVAVTFPADYGAAELAGKDASFEITVKEVKRKQLPAVDEDFAIDAGFDDVDELREDIGGRLLELERRRVAEEFREAALDAAVAAAEVSVPEELSRARAKEMWERMLHSLSHRGVSRGAYLQIVGREEAEILAEMEPEAAQALRREAVLTAVVAAEQVEPSEQDLLDAVGPTAEREGIEPAQVLAQLRAAGRVEELREDLAARQAIDLIAEHAKPIAVERAQAREKLWTPGKDTPGGDGAGTGVVGGAGGADAGTARAGGRLWTPSGS